MKLIDGVTFDSLKIHSLDRIQIIGHCIKDEDVIGIVIIMSYKLTGICSYLFRELYLFYVHLNQLYSYICITNWLGMPYTRRESDGVMRRPLFSLTSSRRLCVEVR